MTFQRLLGGHNWFYVSNAMKILAKFCLAKYVIYVNNVIKTILFSMANFSFDVIAF